MTVYTERNYNPKSDWKIKGHDLYFKGDQMEGYNKLEEDSGVYQYDGQGLTYRKFPDRSNANQCASLDQ